MPDPVSSSVPNPSAPAYEPELWNSRVTDRMRSDFMASHRDALLNVLASFVVSAPLPSMRPDLDGMSDEDKDIKIKTALERFDDKDKLFRDDRKLAQYFSLKPEDIPQARQAFANMRDAYGYQDYANCYSYAMDDMKGLSSWYKTMGGDRPGTRAGGVAGAVDHSDLMIAAQNKGDYETYKRELMAGVIADGATDAGPDAARRDGLYRVAVYGLPPDPSRPLKDDDPQMNMHFLRENRDGTWSHKPSADHPVTDRDDLGQAIMDPKTAQLGRYEFIGFVYVPEGGLNVGHPGAPRTKPGSVETGIGQGAAMAGTEAQIFLDQVMREVKAGVTTFKPPEPVRNEPDKPVTPVPQI